jgi:hypothetical protein
MQTYSSPLNPKNWTHHAIQLYTIITSFYNVKPKQLKIWGLIFNELLHSITEALDSCCMSLFALLVLAMRASCSRSLLAHGHKTSSFTIVVFFLLEKHFQKMFTTSHLRKSSYALIHRQNKLRKNLSLLRLFVSIVPSQKKWILGLKLVFALILVQKLVSNLVIFLIPCDNPRFYCHPMFGPIVPFLSLLLCTFMYNYVITALQEPI